MAKFFDAISSEIAEFIERQHLFFIATGCEIGRINLSPKGMDTFRVLNANSVGYLDLTGSGNETASHLLADGRATIMFCSFDAKPLILRLYGTGRVVRPSSPEWDEYSPLFPSLPGQRQIILMTVTSLQTSCGFAVPRYEFVEERPKLIEWAASKSEEGLREYRIKNNTCSIDGFPAPVHESTS